MKVISVRLPYRDAELEILDFELTDIVTASTPEVSGGMDGGGWDNN